MSEDARDRMAENPPHRQKTVLVPVDVDEPIVGLVMYLNSIPGVRTQTSCQGGKTYRPQVMVTWTDDAMQRLAAEFDVTPLGDHWSYVHPRTDLSVYDQFAVDPLHTAQAEIGRTNALVYMPGQWRCPKCNFQLTQSNLNAQDGTVTARDTPGDHCPNCNSPLWRVTYREAFKDMMIVAEKALGDAARLRAVVDAARKMKFGGYPAHGSGFVIIVTEGNVDELASSIAALDAGEGKKT